MEPTNESVKKNCHEICRVAASHGIKSIVISYDGSGDAGFIEEVTLTNKDGVRLERLEADDITAKFSGLRSVFRDDKWVDEESEQDKTLEEFITQFAYDWLQRHDGGWEINDGAYGEITIDVETKTAKLCHNSRFVDITSSEDEV